MYRSVARRTCVLLLGFAIAASARAENEWYSSWLGKSTGLNLITMTGNPASRCPDGKHVVGMEIRSGTLVDAVRVECASLGANGEHQGQVQGQVMGNYAGGSVRTVRCPSGQVVTAMRARAGEFIDQVSFACRSWSATQGLHGSLRWQPAQGGSGGEPAGPVECPNGKAVAGLNSRTSGSYISLLRLWCTDLPPVQPSGGAESAQSASTPQGRPARTTASRPATIAQGIQPATKLPQPVTPILNTLSSKPASGSSVEITIDGAHFASNQVTRVEIAGTSVPYRVVSPTRIAATVPQHVYTRLDKRRVPIVVTSGGKRITQQMPLR